jgi:hypothetical protein
MPQIDHDQVVGPDGSIISEVIVERPDPVDHDALLAKIASANNLAELKTALTDYLGKTRPGRPDNPGIVSATRKP